MTKEYFTNIYKEWIISENPFGFEKLINEEYFNWYKAWGAS